jgi:hypothetical protein
MSGEDFGYFKVILQGTLEGFYFTDEETEVPCFRKDGGEW